MISKDINEPIILSSKPNDMSFYLSLLIPLLLIGFGLYLFLENREILVFLIGVATFLIQLRRRFRNETYITQDSIYQRFSKHKYKFFRFTDLSYTLFSDDMVYFIFGEEGDDNYSISNDANNFEDIRKHLEQVSQKHLPYHKYEPALRSELSLSDKLGCLDCSRTFGYSSIINWTTEKTRWSFLRKKRPEIPVCPSCKTEGRVIVSRTGKVTPQGLKSLNNLHKNSKAGFNT